MEETHHCLKAGVELNKEGGLPREGKDALLSHRALDVVVLNDDVLLEDLYGVQLVRAFPLCQQHLFFQKQHQHEQQRSTRTPVGERITRQD